MSMVRIRVGDAVVRNAVGRKVGNFNYAFVNRPRTTGRPVLGLFAAIALISSLMQMPTLKFTSEMFLGLLANTLSFRLR